MEVSKKNPCQDAINTICAKLIGKRSRIIYGYSDEIQKMRKKGPATLNRCRTLITLFDRF